MQDVRCRRGIARGGTPLLLAPPEKPDSTVPEWRWDGRQTSNACYDRLSKPQFEPADSIRRENEEIQKPDWEAVLR